MAPELFDFCLPSYMLHCVLQAQSTSAKAKHAQNEQQLLALQAQVATAEAGSQESATAASEACDRIHALEHQLRRGEAKQAAVNSQMSSLQKRLAEANRQLAASNASVASLEAQLDDAQNELTTAYAAAQQPVLALPAAEQQQGGMKSLQDHYAELHAVRAKANAQQNLLVAELAAAKAALAESEQKLKAADVDLHRQRDVHQADLDEVQSSLAMDQHALQQR